MATRYSEALRRDQMLSAATRRSEPSRTRSAVPGRTAHVCWMPGLEVLVVESDPQVAESVCRDLESEGAQARLAGGLVEACRVVRIHGVPDVIVVDIALPNANPYDSLMVLRAVCRHHVPVGFLSRTRLPAARFVGCPVLGGPFTRIGLAAFLDQILLPLALNPTRSGGQ